jgi:hypothetical protein
MTKSVKDHLDNCRQIDQIVKDANALVMKLQSELSVARAVLDGLMEYQHPKLTMKVPFQMREQKEEAVVPARLIQIEIERINSLLGDRA